MEPAPTLRLGPYEILAPIGSGGMGEVYRARDPRLGREVAIKVLSAGAKADVEHLRRLEQEARAAGGLNHPNILAIYDIGTQDGPPYVVSELLEGETLRERLTREGALPVRRVLDLAVQIAHGLAAAHEKGIVHRDLKPENLFITRDARIKILDFGLAKLASADMPAHSDTTGPILSPSTEPGKILGTVGYMSPEQVRGQPLDHRSDIFSFGAILYEMVSGRRAFQGGSAADTLSAILKEEPPELLLPTHLLPPVFEQVVRHCLEKDRELRFASARDLALNLQALAGISTRSTSAPRSGRRLRFLLWGLLGITLLGIAGWLGMRAGGRTEPSFHQLTFKRGAVLGARFVPDGQTILYGAAWDGAPTRLFSTRPGGTESSALPLPPASVLSVSPSGELLLSLAHRFRGGFQFSGTLARVPLSGGAPRELLENVTEACWGPDGTLAVVRMVAGRDRLEYPLGTLVAETVGWISHPRVSPRGDAVAFIDHPNFPEDAGSIMLVDRTGARKVLSEGWSSAQGLIWSAAGNEIWFTAAPTGRSRALYAVSTVGRVRLIRSAPGSLTLQDIGRDGSVLLTRDTLRYETTGRAPGALREQDLSWLDGSLGEALSADGRTLLFYEGGEAGGADYGVYVRPTDGGPAVRLGEGLPTSLSADGKWALTIRRNQGTELVMLPTGPGEPRVLPRQGIKDHLWAFWLPDGRRLVVNGAVAGGGLRSYLQEIDGGVPRALTPEGLWAAKVSADGTLLAAVGTGQPVSLVPLAGGAPQPVRGSLAGDRPAQWSADTRSLFVFRRDELPCRVYRLGLDTGQRELWKELLPADPAGVVAIHEVLITPDANAYAYGYVRWLSDLYLVEGLR